MKRLGLMAVLAVSLVGFSASSALAATSTTINPANAPSGTHLQTGAIGCTVNADQSVSCTTFELAGVGNTNATQTVTATYSATIDCRNNGGQVVATKTGTFTVTNPPVTVTSEKNGRLSVPSASATAPTAAQFLALQTCPNPNWTPEIQAGTSITLSSFLYTLTFAGFSAPYITIDP